MGMAKYVAETRPTTYIVLANNDCGYCPADGIFNFNGFLSRVVRSNFFIEVAQLRRNE
jgi:hypothetical protein